MRRLSVLTDLILLELLAIFLASYCFRGATSACDGFMHLSKVKILMENLRVYGYFPGWNPYWYFGVPMWRIYSPLSYYMVAFLGWIFNLSMLNIVMVWTYLVFSVSSITTYLLAKELGLDRFGCLASGVLFSTSGNLLLYWGTGSYPNVTGVAFSPSALLFLLRAVRKKSLISILAAGLSLAIVVLAYAMNAVILLFFVLIISIVLIVGDPSLIFVSRGLKKPPKYTLTLPKIVISTLLVAGGLSLWWALPFLTACMNAPTIPEVTSGLSVSKETLFEQLLRIVGVSLSRYELPFSPGIGHLILALIGFVFTFSRREAKFPIASLCLTLAFVLSLGPWIGIPAMPLLWWWRFSLYFTLFAAVCGGIAVDSLSNIYERILDLGSTEGVSKKYVKAYSFSFVVLILFVSVYPVLGSKEIVFLGYDLSTPSEIELLESYIEPGERVGTEGGTSYALNMFTTIPQSGGGNIHYAYVVNEFVYVFWRYMFVKQDGRYLRHFSRSYNVRWFIGCETSGLTRTNPESPYELYEVMGFNSSFIKIVEANNILVLFVGEKQEYSWFFTSIALSDAEDVVPVYGGNSLNEYDVAMFKNFDVVYLSGLRRGDVSDLSEYVEDGGCLILDTGTVDGEGGITDLPSPFPVEAITYEESYLVLNSATPHEITENVDFAMFRMERPCTVSHAEPVKNGASVILYDGDKPILVHWRQGLGKVFWTGFGLPYLVMLHEDYEAKSGEEAKLLLNLLRQAESSGINASKGAAVFEQKYLEEIVAYVRDASPRDALWLKMSYYPGWTAQIEGEGQALLRIFTAGPNMMLVFPMRGGDYTVRFYFDKTIDVQVGELVSSLTMVALLIAAFYRAANC